MPKVDIMFCHDKPFEGPYEMKNLLGLSQSLLMRSDEHQLKIQQVVKAAQPRKIYHGHYHVYYSGIYDYGYGSVKVTGLDCDNSKYEEWVSILDVPNKLIEDL